MQILDIGSAAVAAALFIGLLTVTPPPSDIGWSYPSIIVIGGLAILAVACWRTGPYRVRALIWSNPGLKVVYMSGYSEDLVARHGTLTSRVALLRKTVRHRTGCSEAARGAGRAHH